MAHVNFDGLNLRITLAPPERRAVHMREVVVPRAHLAWVRHAPDIWAEVQHDLGLMGLGYPGILLWGTAWTRHRRDFCILHGPGPGLVIGLQDDTYDQVLLSLRDAEAWPLVARLREVLAADARGASGPDGTAPSSTTPTPPASPAPGSGPPG
jgi:hypothetical protein